MASVLKMLQKYRVQKLLKTRYWSYNIAEKEQFEVPFKTFSVSPFLNG